jgi:hypothetical protein
VPARRTAARRMAVAVLPPSISFSTSLHAQPEQWSRRPIWAPSGGGRGGKKAEESALPASPRLAQVRASAGLGSSAPKSAARSPSVAAANQGAAAVVVGSRGSRPRRVKSAARRVA